MGSVGGYLGIRTVAVKEDLIDPVDPAHPGHLAPVIDGESAVGQAIGGDHHFRVIESQGRTAQQAPEH